MLAQLHACSIDTSRRQRRMSLAMASFACKSKRGKIRGRGGCLGGNCRQARQGADKGQGEGAPSERHLLSTVLALSCIGKMQISKVEET